MLTALRFVSVISIVLNRFLWFIYSRLELWYNGNSNAREVVWKHNGDVTMSGMASPITGVSIACSTVCSGADETKHQSSPQLVFVRGIHWSPVDSPHKGLVTRKTSISWRHHDKEHPKFNNHGYVTLVTGGWSLTNALSCYASHKGWAMCSFWNVWHFTVQCAQNW